MPSKKIAKICPEDKELNPFTKRCNKKCATGKERIPDHLKYKFKCYTVCKPGSVRHPDTKRCRQTETARTRRKYTKKTRTNKSFTPTSADYFSGKSDWDEHSGETKLLTKSLSDPYYSPDIGSLTSKLSSLNSISSNSKSRSSHLDNYLAQSDTDKYLAQYDDILSKKSGPTTLRSHSNRSPYSNRSLNTNKSNRSPYSESNKSIRSIHSVHVVPPLRRSARRVVPIERYSPTFKQRKTRKNKKK